MYSVTEKFLEAIRYSGKSKTVVDVYYGTSPIPIVTDLNVIEGSITIDRTADNRRTASISVVEEDADILRELEPWGTELAIRTGVVYPSGVEELVPQGRFRVNARKWKEGASEHLDLDLVDRTEALKDTIHLLDRDYSGKYIKDVIESLVAYSFYSTAIPQVTFVGFDDINPRFPGGSTFQGSHWDTIKTGCEVFAATPYFDRVGDLVIAKAKVISATTTEDDAVWTIDCGEGGVMIEAERTTDRTNSYNGVAVYGGSSNDSKPYAMAFDQNPKSLTWYSGKFGKRTLRIDNDKLTTNAQCLALAQQKLAELTGLTKTIAFKALRNHALDVEDVVIAQYLDGERELHIIDTLTLPIGAGEFSGTTKTIQWVL